MTKLLSMLWRRLRCALTDHGGLTPLYEDGDDWRCKRCGAKVNLDDF